jgi:hypothetical protein
MTGLPLILVRAAIEAHDWLVYLAACHCERLPPECDDTVFLLRDNFGNDRYMRVV